MNKQQYNDFHKVKAYLQSSNTPAQAQTADRIRCQFSRKWFGRDTMAMKMSDACQELLQETDETYRRVLSPESYAGWCRMVGRVRA